MRASARTTALAAFELLRARDDSKDQSYFLWGLTQEQLSRSEFPLGELTKEEVRKLARSVNLPVAEKPESMELCFVPNGNYVQFIHAYSRENGKPLNDKEGDIVTEDGAVIGRHTGVHNYTIGQRKGLGFSAGKPIYVLAIDPEKNRVIVGEDDALRATTFEIENVNWISIQEPRCAPARAGEDSPQARTGDGHRRSVGWSSRPHYLRCTAARDHPGPGGCCL